VIDAAGYANYSARARRLARLLDVAADLGGPILRAAAPRGAPEDPPRSILVIRLDHLGDVLMTTPAIAALRRAFPVARIDALVAPWGRAALEGNPDLSAILEAPAPWYEPSRSAWPPLGAALRHARRLRRAPYDWGFEFRGDPRATLCFLLPAARARYGFTRLGLESLLTRGLPYDRRRSMLDLGLDLVRLAGVPAAGRRPVFHLAPRDLDAAERLLASAGIPAGARLAVVAPSANRAPARWGAAGFAHVAGELARTGMLVVLVGRREDAPVTAAVRHHTRAHLADLTGRTDLRQLAAVLTRATVLVSNDSGPSHLAAAVDCPTVAVFGPTDPEVTFPHGDGRRFVSVRTRMDHPRPCLDPRCRSDHGMGDLDPAEVVEAVRSVLRAGAARPAVP
jgi:lipopolysaccharide heptosyltransferase II